MEYFDVHAHTWKLADEREVLKECERKGIVILNNGLNSRTNDIVLTSTTLKAVGWWPGEKSSYASVRAQASTKEVVAIGEIGLDFYHQFNERKQIKQFRQMLGLALELGKPVIVHSRKAESKVLEILANHDLEVVLHAFTGNKKMIKEGVDKGYYFSIPTIVLKSSNFQNLARMVPEEQLLTESDTPYLGVEKPNTPLTMPLIVEKISEIKEHESRKELFNNARSLFLN